jgi:ribosomal-protein-alanine N-acetyltransferase
MIQTTRCELTALRPDDLEYVVRLYTDAEVRRFLGGPVDEEAIRSAFPMLIEPGTATQHWAIRLKHDNTFVGVVSLGAHHDGTDTEVSYQLLPEWWGQGYAKETVQAVVNHALDSLGFPRVIAETQTVNVASCRLLERLGMRLERMVERFGAEQAIYVTDTSPKARCHVQSN